MVRDETSQSLSGVEALPIVHEGKCIQRALTFFVVVHICQDDVASFLADIDMPCKRVHQNLTEGKATAIVSCVRPVSSSARHWCRCERTGTSRRLSGRASSAQTSKACGCESASQSLAVRGGDGAQFREVCSMF